MMATGDDEPQMQARPDVPPFPWHSRPAISLIGMRQMRYNQAIGIAMPEQCCKHSPAHRKGCFRCLISVAFRASANNAVRISSQVLLRWRAVGGNIALAIVSVPRIANPACSVSASSVGKLSSANTKPLRASSPHIARLPVRMLPAHHRLWTNSCRGWKRPIADAGSGAGRSIKTGMGSSCGATRCAPRTVCRGNFITGLSLMGYGSCIVAMCEIALTPLIFFLVLAKTMLMTCALKDDSIGEGDPARKSNCPDFPWYALRFCLTSGGDYAPNTRMSPVPMRTRNLTGIRGVVEKRAQYGPVLRAVARAFHENRQYHRLTEAHWRILMACEAGLVERPDRRGMPQWTLYSSAHPAAVMPDHEAATAFGVRPDLVRRYHNEARRAVEKEWEYLHSGWDESQEAGDTCTS